MEASAKLESKDEADARVARARANRMEFELAVRKKQFIAIEEVRRINTRAIAACKSKMLAIPASTAPRHAVLNDPNECEAVTRKEIIQALTELSKMDFNK